MIGGVLYSPNGIGLVEAFHPGTGKTLWVQEPFPDEPGQGLRGDSARGVAYWSDGSDRRLFVDPRRVPDRARPAHGQTGSRRSASKGRVNLRPGLGPRATQYAWTGAPQVCRDVVIVGVGLGGSMSDRPMHKEAPPGSRAGVRRAHRQAAMDVQSDSASRRGRQRDLGERFVVVQRRRESVVAHQRRRGAGAGLSAADGSDQRHVRRASARRQRVRQHAGVRQVPDRRTRLALPDRPPRSVGLRPAGRADPRRHHASTDGRSRRSCSSRSRRSRSSSIARPESRSGRSRSGPFPRPTRRASAPPARSRFRPNRRRSIARACRSTI